MSRTLEQIPSQYNHAMQAGFAFTAARSVVLHERKTYTLYALLAEVGGFAVTLYFIGFLLVSTVQRTAVREYLVSHLFFRKPSKATQVSTATLENHGRRSATTGTNATTALVTAHALERVGPHMVKGRCALLRSWCVRDSDRRKLMKLGQEKLTR